MSGDGGDGGDDDDGVSGCVVDPWCVHRRQGH